jgi:CDP-6-deoxy-D-xylo-4-hexulose-3-dehydrase
MSLDSIKKMTSVKTKGIFLVHLLGQPANIQEILDFAKERDLFVIEDCCESMGARFNNIKVGNFGKMGSFSFYFGHHMTTIEGGMIVTDDEESYDLLKSMRSHGWVRNSKREGLYENYLDKKYLFDIQGYNLRSTNINAAIGLVQLNKLDDFIKKRLENHIYFLDQIKKLGLGFQKVNLSETSSFCFAILFNNQFQRDYILKNLERSKKVETRKIVAGNLLNQPVFKKMSFRKDSASNSEKLDKLGIYIPNNQFIDQTKIDYMLESIKELISESNYFMNLSYQNLGEGKDIMPKQVIN